MYSEKKLHIISFDNPWPPDYGGVIDVFHRIRVLSEKGVRIVLHTFIYGRPPAEELNRYCEKVYYYNRRRYFNPFSLTPYIVSTRRHPELLNNLNADTAPVLFEGLHTCSLLGHHLLRGRTRIVRMHNIEHSYYYYSARNETNLFRKAWFLAESFRLKRFEKVLKDATTILAISENDRRELATRFPRTEFLGPFQGNQKVLSKTGTGNYALYHGKLSVAENDRAARYLAAKVFSQTNYPFLIAGSNPEKGLKRLISRQKNTELIENPSAEELESLIAEAHINILPAFQPTGLKLKLVNALHNGRWLVSNSSMVSGTGYESLCHIAGNADEMIALIDELKGKPFGEMELAERQRLLITDSSRQKDIDRLLHLI
ncbi:MAG: glycosyltransferase family 1 protein [Bacteroidales bacterium]